MKISEVTAQIYKVLNQKTNLSITQVYDLYKDEYNTGTIVKTEFEKKQWSCKIERKKSMVAEAKKKSNNFSYFVTHAAIK